MADCFIYKTQSVPLCEHFSSRL